ncbi:hypothetical protein K523DRAFT_232135 [Schizophyllum commune Tattone D]|nr:hypothetical protein K525DRAFT_215657 [Schizophyllum commune Loenen D]KAI5833730.1 hypothetical protein K523DRAFT_232135 [Schizophyllum commune Tattone D]
MHPVNGDHYGTGSSSYSSYSSYGRSRGNSYSTYGTPGPRPPPPPSPPPAVLRTPSAERTPSPMDEDEDDDAEPDYTSPYGADIQSRYLPRAPPYAIPTTTAETSSPHTPASKKATNGTRPQENGNSKSPAPSAPAYSNGYWHR